MREDVQLYREQWDTDGKSLETVGWVLWDTERYCGGGYVTEPVQGYTMEFFQRTKSRQRESNMWHPGFLPAPNAFLTQGIRIRGVTRKMADGAVLEFIIGHKFYLTMPLENFTRHQHNVTLSQPLFIGPLVQFCVRLSWERFKIFNTPRQPKIEIQLVGEMVRPRQ